MKKVLCIILSALLIGALCLVPASAAEASLSYTLHRGADMNLTSFADINALPTVSLPVSYDGSVDSLGNNFFFVLSLPSFLSINSLDVISPDNLGAQFLILYDSSDSVITTLNVGSMDIIDLSSYDNISALVYKTGISSGRSISSITFDLDYESPSVWNGIGEFITGMFGAIAAIVTGIIGSENNLILLFVIAIPLAAIAIGYLFKFLGKKRKRGK